MSCAVLRLLSLAAFTMTTACAPAATPTPSIPPAIGSAQMDPQLTADVDAFAQQIYTLSGVPALAIAVVKEDAPVLVKGYGYADVERRIPATENTVFYIASTTKAFTALTSALMAERGMLDLDAPITLYLEDARWAAAVKPDSITMRDLLRHTHGIANSGPVVWRTAFTGVHTNPLLKELLQYHGPSEAGRAFRYTNIGYNIAGIIIDDVTRGRWQDALAAYVLNPAGMTRTTAYISRFDSTQLAMPYSTEPDGLKRLHFAKNDTNMQAAGGLVSTAADLARWLELQINLGALDGRQVFPRRVVAETQRLQASTSERRGDMQMIGYSLGWNVGLLNGDTVLLHGGGFSAFRTMIAFSPRQRVGVAVMTNGGAIGGGAIEIIAQYVLERARGADAQQRYAQRLTEVPDIIERMKSGIAADRARRAARPQTLSKPLDAYAGIYENAQGGVMTWTVRDGRLWAEIGALKSITEVFDAATDRLRLELEPGAGEVVQFKFENGRAVSILYGNREFMRR